MAQSLLGVFWGVWFAQFSRSVLQAESDIGLDTGQLRAAYVVGALACLLGLTVLLWMVQNVSQRLLEPLLGQPLSRETVRAETIGDVLWLLCSYVLICTIVILVPVSSYLLFKGLSAHEVALTAAVIPVWLGMVLLFGLVRIATSRG